MDNQYNLMIGNSTSSSPLHLDYVQVVKVETCIAEGQQCNIVTYGVTTVCRQKYVYHR